EEDIAEPRPRLDDGPVPGVEGRQERQGHEQREKAGVPRGEGGGGVVRREHEEEQAVVEGLDRVIDRRDEEPQGLALRTLERPDVDEDGEEQPEEQEVADGPADIRQAATEDEQREEPAAERGARDAPGRQNGQRPFHARVAPGGRSRSTVSTASFPSVEAASTIPLDSIPMSFTGSRFATTTTFLPTSSAGA